MKSKNLLPFAVLCSVPFVMVLGNSMLIPVLPKIKSVLHLSQIQSGLIITAFSVPAGLVIMFVGILSDRIGRKEVISPALVIYGLGGAGAALAGAFLENPYSAIIAARVVQGIGAAGTAPIAIALTGDIFQSEERSKAQGLLEASNGLGKVLSPVLGAGSGLVSWWAPFALYAAISIPAAIAVWVLTPEPKQKGEKIPMRRYFRNLREILKAKGWSLGACYIAGGVVLMILFGVLFYFSDLLESRFSVTGLLKGIIIAVPILIMSVTSFLVGLFMQTHRNWLKVATWVGLLVVAAALLLSSLITKALWIGIAMVFVGLGSGFVLPSLDTMITSAASGQARGMVTSVFGAVRFFGVALGPPAFGWLMEHGRFVIFFPPAVLAAATAIFVMFALQLELLTPPKTGDPDAKGVEALSGPDPAGTDQPDRKDPGGTETEGNLS